MLSNTSGYGFVDTAMLMVGVTTLVFGSKVVSLFQKSSIDIDITCPLESIPNENRGTNKSEMTADSLQIIYFSNKGLANSNKLVIRIKAQGKITNFEVESCEDIQYIDCIDNELIVKLDRLSRNIGIRVALRLVNENRPLTIYCIDNDGAKEIVRKLDL